MEKKKDVYYVKKEIELDDLDLEISKIQFDYIKSQASFKESLERQFTYKIFGIMKQTFKFPKSTKTHVLFFSAASFEIFSDIRVEFKNDKAFFNNIYGTFTIMFLYRSIETLPEAYYLPTTPATHSVTCSEFKKILQLYTNEE